MASLDQPSGNSNIDTDRAQWRSYDDSIHTEDVFSTTHESSTRQERVISIPKFSLTAFRLTYSTPEIMRRSSECLLIGGLPDLWLKDEAPGLFSAATRLAKNNIKRQYRTATSLVSQSIHSGSSVPIEETVNGRGFYSKIKASSNTTSLLRELNVATKEEKYGKEQQLTKSQEQQHLKKSQEQQEHSEELNEHNQNNQNEQLNEHNQNCQDQYQEQQNNKPNDHQLERQEQLDEHNQWLIQAQTNRKSETSEGPVPHSDESSQSIESAKPIKDSGEFPNSGVFPDQERSFEGSSDAPVNGQSAPVRDSFNSLGSETLNSVLGAQDGENFKCEASSPELIYDSDNASSVFLDASESIPDTDPVSAMIGSGSGSGDGVPRPKIIITDEVVGKEDVDPLTVLSDERERSENVSKSTDAHKGPQTIADPEINQTGNQAASTDPDSSPGCSSNLKPTDEPPENPLSHFPEIKTAKSFRFHKHHKDSLVDEVKPFDAGEAVVDRKSLESNVSSAIKVLKSDLKSSKRHSSRISVRDWSSVNALNSRSNSVSPLERSRSNSPRDSCQDAASCLSSSVSQHVRFDTPKASTSKVSLLMPMPMKATEIKDLDWVQADQHRLREKFKTFATTSKGLASNSRHEIRSRINRVIARHYKAGEILRTTKMLVLTKEILNCTSAATFTENENADTRIYERWSEYLVVLRRSSSSATPVILQFYDLTMGQSATKRKPEFTIPLGIDVSAHLYSDSDKSLCLVRQKNNRAFAYILKSPTSSGALMLLYFVKQSLGHETDEKFNIYIPDIDLRLSFELPLEVLDEAAQHRKQVKLTVLPKGYQVEFTPVVEYMRQKIRQVLEATGNPKVQQWMKECKRNMWFCYKVYDRLEWIENNSEMFYVQNQVLTAASFQLELREVSHYAMNTSAEYCGGRYEEPLPIEGFLMRTTKTSGRRNSGLRSFHRLSYFFTNDNLLFLTKFYKGMPPSPNNELVRESGKARDVQATLPMLYYKCPYETDDDGHIPWLHEDNFEEMDKQALEEFERRSQQIIKADAVVDLTAIKDIRYTPAESLTVADRLFLAYCWYSKTGNATDAEIVDSAFEIEINNGSTLTLQAPSRAMRHEWVTRLWRLKEYWTARKEEDLNRLMDMRERNKEKLWINEYVDSNVVSESNTYEFRNSYVDPHLHNIDSIAMTRSILYSGYLYEKGKKHTEFRKFMVVLCPGFLVLFSRFRRSKVSGVWRKSPCLQHYFTIPISQCYIYSGSITSMDLLDRNKSLNVEHPERHALPRLYPDGWKSSEEESMRCFTLWVGKKRNLNKSSRRPEESLADGLDSEEHVAAKNPGLTTLVKRFGITGKSMVFMARSRQEREIWTYKILSEIDRYFAG